MVSDDVKTIAPKKCCLFWADVDPHSIFFHRAENTHRGWEKTGREKCPRVSETSKTEKKRGLPFWETLVFSYTIRCKPTPLGAPDRLSQLVPSITRIP